jgi:hypothetical protein
MDSHGLFYVVDAVFMVIGIAGVLFHKRRDRAYLLLALLLVSPLPSAVSGGETQYVLRSAFMFPVLIMFIGYGIYVTVQGSRRKTIATGVIVAAYLVSFVNFGYLYMYKNPVANYDSFGVSGRIVARYIQLSRSHDTKVEILFNGVNKGLLKQYIFFTNGYTQYNHSQVAALFTSTIVHLDTVTFSDCAQRSADDTVTAIIPFNLLCIPKKPLNQVLNVTNYVTNQPMYVIYNDKLCRNFPVAPYLDTLTLHDFNIETMGEKEFCQTFFTRDSEFVSPDKTGTAGG